MAEAPSERLFFALWPAPELARRITGAAAEVARLRQLKGKPVPPERAHLTLLFLGEVAPDAAARLREAVATIRVPPFELVLDQAACFYRSRAFWVGPSTIPEGLLTLWERLRDAGTATGVVGDYKPLIPHVTCLRDVADRIRPVPIAPLRWRPREFALVRSPEYHVVSHWPLQTAST